MLSGLFPRRVIVLIFTLGFAGSVLAHHGVTGRYDASRPILISGVVTATTFAPPHPVLCVRVGQKEVPDAELGRPGEYFGPVAVRPEDVGEVRTIELSPVRMFYDLARKLKPGDRVTVVALRNCLSPHQLRSTWLRLTNGEVASYTGDWAPRVDGC